MSHCETLLTITGGNEANSVLSQCLIGKWLLRGGIDYRESLLFLESFNNLSAYIYYTKYSKKISSDNDIKAYITRMNNIENNGKIYTVDQLAKQSLAGLINPFQFIAAYSYVVTYLFKGRNFLHVPMINIKNTRYLPAFHYAFSPFGSEYYFDNYVVRNNRVYTGYIRYGDPKYHRFWGFGMNALNIVSNKYIMIAPEFDVWNQPAFQLGGKTLRTQKAGYGGAVSSNFSYYFGKNSKAGITLRLGYKTADFLQVKILLMELFFQQD